MKKTLGLCPNPRPKPEVSELPAFHFQKFHKILKFSSLYIVL